MHDVVMWGCEHILFTPGSEESRVLRVVFVEEQGCSSTKTTRKKTCFL